MFPTLKLKDGRPFFEGFFVDRVYTHTGAFHADDVFCAALLSLVYPEVEIVRCKRLPDGLAPGTLSFDLVGAPFDHHGTVRLRRPAGTLYSSFGLMWDTLGRVLVSDPIVWLGVDTSLVQFIDRADNGGESCFVSEMILGMDKPDGDTNQNFYAAVQLAVQLLTVTIQKYEGISRALSLIKPFLYKAAVNDASFVEIPFFRSDFIPYIKELAPCVKYIISPDTSDPAGAALTTKFVIRSLVKNVSFHPTVDRFCALSKEGTGRASKPKPLECGITFVHPNGGVVVFREREIAYRFLDCHIQRLGS